MVETLVKKEIMQVEIKSIISPDILDFKNFQPIDSENFSFLLEFIVGVKGEKGGEEFSIEVFTPKWLLENYQKGDVLFCRHRLIVFEYNIDRIIKEIESRIESVIGNSWEEITNKISRIAHWEFEDYKPH